MLRLTTKIEELAAHLARYHYHDGSIVGRNVRAELEGLEVEAHDLETRIIEVRSRAAAAMWASMPTTMRTWPDVVARQ